MHESRVIPHSRYVENFEVTPTGIALLPGGITVAKNERTFATWREFDLRGTGKVLITEAGMNLIDNDPSILDSLHNYRRGQKNLLNQGNREGPLYMLPSHPSIVVKEQRKGGDLDGYNTALLWEYTRLICQYTLPEYIHVVNLYGMVLHESLEQDYLIMERAKGRTLKEIEELMLDSSLPLNYLDSVHNYLYIPGITPPLRSSNVIIQQSERKGIPNDYELFWDINSGNIILEEVPEEDPPFVIHLIDVV